MSDKTPDKPEAPASSLRTLSQVVPYLWPDGEAWIKWRVILALAALCVAKAVAVGTPYLYKAAVDALAGEAPDPVWMLGLGAMGLTFAYGAARLMSAGFQELRDAIFASVAQRALRRLALRTFRHVHALSLSYHLSRKTGGLARIIERGVKGIEFLLRFLLFSVIPLSLELLMISFVLWAFLDFRYLLVVISVILVYVAFTFQVTQWRLKLRKQMNDHDTDANQKAVDSLLNFETVKYFSADRREAERYDVAMAGYELAALRTARSLALLNIGQSLLLTLALVSVMAMAVVDIGAGRLTVGDFVMVNAYMIQITMPLSFLGTVYREIRQSLVDMGEMFGLLDREPDVRDRPGAVRLEVAGGAVEFDGVGFGYEPQRPILRGFGVSVPAGTSLAIVGRSGSGKSTVGRLLFRFYDVDSGALRIDGQDVRDVTQESLRDAIGVVPQDTVLFNETIGYNIGYGADGATQEQVEAAAQAARLGDFVARLPQGYSTVVGERGLKLSGGERQRVGIARALLKNPPILLLDEATSALDTETERGIQQALEQAGKGRTVIVIAHRLSTVAQCDRIIVLEDGGVAESGSHDALLALGGRYAELWSRQAAEREEREAQRA